MNQPGQHQSGERIAVTTDTRMPIPRIKSQDLFQNVRELEIDHGGRIYKLRLTQLNKLILTA